MSEGKPKGPREVDEALKQVLTPEFDAELKRLMSVGKPTSPLGTISVTPEGTRLRTSLERLYGAFKTYTMSDPFDYCDHCIAAHDAARFRATPLRELTHDDLWTIATNITLTIGSARNLKYFLPRLIEGAVENAGYNSEVVFGAIGRAEFASWSELERDSVSLYVRAQAEANLIIEPSDAYDIWVMSTLLCSASMLPLPLASVLDKWIDDARPTARRHLLEYICSDVAIEGHVRLEHSWWTRETEVPIVAWLKQSKTRAALDVALAALPAGDLLFKEAHSKIQRLNE